jgi:hypothetical protein
MYTVPEVPLPRKPKAFRAYFDNQEGIALSEHGAYWFIADHDHSRTLLHPVADAAHLHLHGQIPLEVGA